MLFDQFWTVEYLHLPPFKMMISTTAAWSDSFEYIGDNTSYILKYSGFTFNKCFSIETGQTNHRRVDIIEEYYIGEFKGIYSD